MEMDLVKKIETRISDLEKRSKELSDFINGCAASIKKILTEKSKATDESNAVLGAIQAFKSVIGEISENENKITEELKTKEVSEKKDISYKKEKNV